MRHDLSLHSLGRLFQSNVFVLICYIILGRKNKFEPEERLASTTVEVLPDVTHNNSNNRTATTTLTLRQ
jgi:hypothetical protein